MSCLEYVNIPQSLQKSVRTYTKAFAYKSHATYNDSLSTYVILRLTFIHDIYDTSDLVIKIISAFQT